MREIITKVGISLPCGDYASPDQFSTFFAVWDTGATDSVITPKMRDVLGLATIGKSEVYGVNSFELVDLCLIDVLLPNNVHVPQREVTVCDIGPGPADMLIGMDIIQMGDFSIANYGGNTLFSFAFPPFENPTNLYDKANAINPKRR